jgi:SAM-dependent methyltransferase
LSEGSSGRESRPIRYALVDFLSTLPAPLGRAAFWLTAVWSEGTRAVLKHPGSWQALEPFYTLPRRRGSPSERLWGWALDNARAMPERLAIVVDEVTAEARLRAVAGNEPVRILSIGSGSARPILEAAAAVEAEVRLMLVDIDAEALDFSRQLAQQLGIHHATQHVANILRLGSGQEDELRTFRPHIVEMVGLLDYFNDRVARLMLARLARLTPEGSLLLIGNIVPNRERLFLEKSLKWPEMEHRDPEAFVALVASSGFIVERVRQAAFHTVVRARRSSEASGAPAADA